MLLQVCQICLKQTIGRAFIEALVGDRTPKVSTDSIISWFLLAEDSMQSTSLTGKAQQSILPRRVPSKRLR